MGRLSSSGRQSPVNKYWSPKMHVFSLGENTRSHMEECFKHATLTTWKPLEIEYYQWQGKWKLLLTQSLLKATRILFKFTVSVTCYHLGIFLERLPAHFTKHLSAQVRECGQPWLEKRKDLWNLPLNERANTASDGDFYNPPKSVGALGTRMLEDVLVFSGPRSVLPHVTH